MSTKAPTKKELWLDNCTTEDLLQLLGYGKPAAQLIRFGLRAIASSIKEQQKAYPDSVLAQIGAVHPSMMWQGARTRWDGPPMDASPVISLTCLEAVLTDPLALQQAIDRKPAHLSDESAIVLLDRFVLRVKQLS